MNLLFELYLTLLTNIALDSGKQTNIINENMSFVGFQKNPVLHECASSFAL